MDWGYAISTLLIRFVGIFVVLAMLMICIQAAGWVIRRVTKKKDTRVSEQVYEDGRIIPDEVTPGAGGKIPGEIVAALAAAIEMANNDRSPEGRWIQVPSPPRTVTPSSHWATAGRLEQLKARLPGGRWN